MMKRFLSIATLIFLSISCNSQNNISSDPEEQEIQRVYTKNIERISKNDFENDLISGAESVYPTRDSVLVYISPRLLQSIPDTNLWFYEIFDGVLIPFAITYESIIYYENLIDSMSAGNQYQFITKANFEYHAEIEFSDSYTFEGENPFTQEPLPSVSFENVYVVTMTLRWDHYCGLDCGLTISRQRIVVFDQSGNILNVFYDGPIPIMVS